MARGALSRILATVDTAAGRQSRIMAELLFLARAAAGGLARDVGPACLLEALEEAAEAVSAVRCP